MGQRLHGCAGTTRAILREIQESDKSVSELSRTLGPTRRTVSTLRRRDFVDDLPMCPRNPRSKALTEAQEALCLLYRRPTRLPLDDCLYWLEKTIPHLSRSKLHRCLQDHGISRLAELKGDRPREKKIRNYPLGYFHVDIATVSTGEGRLCLFVAIDRTGKYVHAEVHRKGLMAVAAAFLRNLIEVVPYRIHTIPTDNGVQFTNRMRDRQHAAAHVFEKICGENGMDHRLTKVCHPRMNVQAERINRTLKEATVKHYHYDTHEQFREHPGTFLNAYNFTKRLKALRGRTPFEEIMNWWRKEPERFILEPGYDTLGLKTSIGCTPLICSHPRLSPFQIG